MRAKLAFFALPLVALVPGCFVYDKAWIDLANGSGGRLTGGSSSGGTTPGNGGSKAGGGPSTGGQQSGGNTANGGGQSGGSPGGGSDSGGSMGGDAPTGGQASDGGSSSGGSNSGGSGTGGTPIPTSPLVTDFPTANKASYISGNFSGTIARYAQTDVVWSSTSVAGMVVARPDDSSDFWLNVKGDFPDVDGWGTDIVIPLRSSGIDISGFTGIRIDAAGFIADDSLLRIAIEDDFSRRPSSGECPTDGTLPDCDKHAESLDSYPLSDTIDTYDFPLAFFTDSCGGTTCTRANSVNLKKVYALHFRMDPTVETAMDFAIDNITFY